MDKKGPVCQEHSKTLKLWCVNCKTGICVLCVINHNQQGHKLVEPEEVETESDQILQKFQAQLQELQANVNGSKEKLREIHQGLQQNKNESSQQLIQDIDGIIQALQTLKQELLDQYNENYFLVAEKQITSLEALMDKKSQELNEVLEEVTKCSSGEKNSVKKIDYFINNGKQAELQEQIDQHASKINFLQKELDKFKPAHPSFELISLNTNFGKMVNQKIPSPDILSEILGSYENTQAPIAARRLIPSKVSWNPKQKSKYIDILNDGKTAQKQKSYFGWASILTDYCIDRGRAMISFKVESAGKTGFADLYVGLCTNDQNIKFEEECLNGYGKTQVWALNRNGDFYEPKRGCISKDRELRKFDTGDVVNITMDFAKKTVTFQVNDGEEAVFGDLVEQAIPYICLGGSNQSISIQNFYVS